MCTSTRGLTEKQAKRAAAIEQLKEARKLAEERRTLDEAERVAKAEKAAAAAAATATGAAAKHTPDKVTKRPRPVKGAPSVRSPARKQQSAPISKIMAVVKKRSKYGQEQRRKGLVEELIELEKLKDGGHEQPKYTTEPMGARDWAEKGHKLHGVAAAWKQTGRY